jgi:hypothetical protein
VNLEIEPWVDTQTVANHTGKSVYTVLRRARAGEWPGHKDGGEWMFKLSAVDEALNPPAVDLWAATPQARSRKRAT